MVSPSYHVRGQLVSWQVFDILVLGVDYFCEFASVHHFFKHPHVYCVLKCGIFGSVGADDLGNSGTPVDKKEKK